MCFTTGSKIDYIVSAMAGQCLYVVVRVEIWAGGQVESLDGKGGLDGGSRGIYALGINSCDEVPLGVSFLGGWSKALRLKAASLRGISQRGSQLTNIFRRKLCTLSRISSR